MQKAALITGASSGIGAATAVEFSKNGYFVYLMGRNKEKLEQVALRCRQGASLMSCDINDNAALQKRLNEMLTTKIHRIEVVVNNAGIYQNHSTEDGSDDIWLAQLQTNLLGPVKIVRAFFPYFKQNGGGSIVNIGSTLGTKPTANTAAYSASKAALINWTQSLALEGGPFGIRANVVNPGIVDTPIHAFHNLQGAEKEEVLKKLNPLQPLGRVGSPEDIAKAAYFLGSNASSWTTGAMLSVDGGINIT